MADVNEPYRDTGVFDATAARWLTRVAGSPCQGQYACDDAGRYVFAPEDKGHALLYGDALFAAARDMA